MHLLCGELLQLGPRQEGVTLHLGGEGEGPAAAAVALVLNLNTRYDSMTQYCSGWCGPHRGHRPGLHPVHPVGQVAAVLGGLGRAGGGGRDGALQAEMPTGELLLGQVGELGDAAPVGAATSIVGFCCLHVRTEDPEPVQYVLC